MLERIGHLRGELDRQRHLQRPMGGDKLAEVGPFDELEDDEMPALLRTHRVDAADVLVVEPGRRLGLIPKPTEQFRVGRLLLRKHLDGHDPIECGVDRPEHRPHSPAPHEPLQGVGAQTLPLEGPPDLIDRADLRPSTCRLCRHNRGISPVVPGESPRRSLRGGLGLRG